MEQVILVRYGELALKGRNRNHFEDILRNHIQHVLRDLPESKVQKTHGRFFLHKVPGDYVERLSRIPGIVALNPSWVVPTHYLDILEGAKKVVRHAKDLHPEFLTFKVETKRAYKGFSVPSPQMSNEAGAAVLKDNGLKVDVHNPHFTLRIEIREENTYIYYQEVKGPGGLPAGSGGKSLVLISGGIDSPVAAYLAIKRGVSADLLHFWSYPITSIQAKDKVLRIGEILKDYNPRLKLYIAPFTNIQTAIMDSCPEKLRVTVMRRMMMRVASVFAKKVGALALFTGESLGQVASQTLESLVAIEDGASLPILRPLITQDKRETVELAKKIGTYQISCLPYEDCCTVFVPKHPATKPSIKEAEKAEERLDIESLVEDCIQGIYLENLSKT